MKKIQIYERRLDGEIIASTKTEVHKYLGVIKEDETFKVLYRDDEPLLTSFEANLEDIDFLESYTKKDYDDQLKNAEPEERGLGCSYYVVEMKVEFQDVNYFGEEIWTVEYVNSYYYWEKFMQN